MPIRLLILTVLSLLPACGRIPEPINHEYTQQKKMQAVEHWNLLARDVASRLNHELVIYDFLTTPVYVKETCGDEAKPCDQNQTSSFNEAFRDLLITQLVQYGIQTRSEPSADALSINYKVQIVHHRAKRLRSAYPGTFTALTAAVLVLRNAPSEMIALAAAGAVDVANSAYTQKGHYEILITTSIVNVKKYVFRTSDIYYINDEDFWQYQESMPQAGVISLTAPQMNTRPVAAHASSAELQSVTQEPAAPARMPEKALPVSPPDEQTVIEPSPLTEKPSMAKEPDTDI